ncbi:tRNA(Ile)-lysidine synthase [uncultured delta proteobacterium]|uniref:tRNA(Ile)-lysidine synthase n=1 Tax=uncultured delta proteobacterium TaxID=34034 RepID=A0A212J1S7_9DELT|nr:tRNA(Ile)-lysidine synthase [uncultured delta proteobacterium]
MTERALPLRLRDLPSGAARFCLAVERFCRDELLCDLTGESMVVAYSGGADSKALLFALFFLAPRLDLTLHAATLDHGLRPESGAEVRDAAAVCRRLGVRFHTAEKDVAGYAAANGVGLEEAGRILRLEFLKTVRASTGCGRIAAGHQLNDLAEDCLMRMTRGAGWPALAGMAGIVDDTRIIRPLLLTPRAAIEAFLREIGEPWHDDAMNADDAYFRNRVRNHILPLFLKENPAFLDTVADRWRMARDDAAFFKDALAAIPAVRVEDGIFLSRNALAGLPPSLRVRKYRDIVMELGKGQATAEHLAALDAAWRRNEGGKEIQFPGGKKARIKEGGVFFCAGGLPDLGK